MTRATAADVDGAHIQCLLLPPLHRVEVSGSSEFKYTYSDAELHVYLSDLERRGKKYKDPQRYKGLGEMDADQLRETTMSPATRSLRRITMGDAFAADNVFDLLMGSDVPPRKEFIVDGATGLTRDRIDA